MCIYVCPNPCQLPDFSMWLFLFVKLIVLCNTEGLYQIDEGLSRVGRCKKDAPYQSLGNYF